MRTARFGKKKPHGEKRIHEGLFLKKVHHRVNDIFRGHRSIGIRCNPERISLVKESKPEFNQIGHPKQLHRGA